MVKKKTKEAQGSLEYLLLIGGAIIVVAVVIVILAGMAETQKNVIGETESEFGEIYKEFGEALGEVSLFAFGDHRILSAGDETTVTTEDGDIITISVRDGEP